LTVTAAGVRRGDLRVGLQRLLTGLAGTDAIGLLDRHDEHLAVADGAGSCVLEDRVHDRLHVTARDHALELDLRPQPVGQLGAAVALRDALLAPGSLDLRDGERGEPEAQELCADGLEGLVADERLDLLHDAAGTSLRALEGTGARGMSREPGALANPMSSGAGMNASG
jgi:hypothetical protein